MEQIVSFVFWNKNIFSLTGFGQERFHPGAKDQRVISPLGLEKEKDFLWGNGATNCLSGALGQSHFSLWGLGERDLSGPGLWERKMLLSRSQGWKNKQKEFKL